MNALQFKTNVLEDQRLEDKTATIVMLVNESFDKIECVWPMGQFVASNPLKPHLHLKFEQIEEIISKWNATNPSIETLNYHTIKWMTQMFSPKRNAILFPKGESLFNAWKQCIIHDSTLVKNTNELFLIWEPQYYLQFCMAQWGLNVSQQQLLFESLLLSLPGWSGYIKHINVRSEASFSLTEYMAMRCYLMQALKISPRQITLALKSATQSLSPQMSPHEHAFCNTICNTLTLAHHELAPTVQYVFCIDVRSEPMRRALEEYSDLQTFSCAGHFGLPIELLNPHTGQTTHSCPVIVPAQYTVEHQKTPSFVKRCFSILAKIFWKLKNNTSSVTLIESMGLFAGLMMLKNSFWGGRKTEQDPVKLNLDSMSLQDRIGIAHAFLESLSINQFASTIVICGHKSESNNNVWASSLDCGACAGRPGTLNALLICEILNNNHVLRALRKKGHKLPIDVQFFPAIHNTTTQSLTTIGDNAIPEFLSKRHETVTQKLTSSQLKKQSRSWSEARPEWGLNNNAGFIIGPRAWTKQHDLKSRCFLHSFDESMPNPVERLSQLFAGPVTVAHWINMHYYFSAKHNALFGSGSKVSQNPIGQIGVMQGIASDLMTGLPIQSLYHDNGTCRHHAQRLQIVVCASKSVVEQALAATPDLAQALENKWLYLYCFEKYSQQWYLYGDKTWTQIH